MRLTDGCSGTCVLWRAGEVKGREESRPVCGTVVASGSSGEEGGRRETEMEMIIQQGEIQWVLGEE